MVIRKENKSRQSVGRYGEELALTYLLKKGCSLVEKNYRLRSGEVDIIVLDGDTLVFVEVKTRKTTHFGSPFDAVDYRKQQQISQTALAFIHQQGDEGLAVRFDVLAVFLDSRQPRIEWLKNAFDYCGT